MRSAGYRIFFVSLLFMLLLASALPGCGSKAGGQAVQFDNPADYAFPADVVSVGEGGNSRAELKRLPDDAFWTTYYTDPRPMHGAEYHRSTVTTDGTIVAVGETTDFENGTGELLIGKHGPDGQMLAGWPKLYAGEGLRWNEAHDVLVDSAGTITISGYVITQGEQWRFALWRFDVNGNIMPGWPQYPVGSHAYGTSAIIDSGGDILACGGYGSTGLDSMVLVKYQADGTPVAGWPKTYQVAKSQENFGYDLIQDDDGNLVVAGYTANSADGPRDAVLWRLDADGSLLEGWPQVWDSGLAVYDEYFSVSQDAGGDYCLVGTTDGTTEENGRLMVAACGKDGSRLDGWPQVLAGNGLRDASPPDAWRGSGDVSGAIVGAGTYIVDQPPGTPAQELPDTRVNTVRYSGGGSMLKGFPKSLDRPGYLDATRSCMADDAGNIYVVGWSESVDGTHADYSTFVAKYPPAAYATGRPAVTMKQGITYSKLAGFSEKLGADNRGSVAYQLSPDGNTWYYFDGTRWSKAGNQLQANTAADVNKNIGVFGQQVGGGTLYAKALLVSNGDQAVHLESIDVKHD